jgi:hypothetical protein
MAAMAGLRGRAGGVAVGRRKGGRGTMGWLQEGDQSPATACSVSSWGRRKEEREKEKREKEKMKTKNGKFLNLEILGEKNKR